MTDDAAKVAEIAAEPAMWCPVEFDTMPTCDCPYEHWHIGDWCFDIHFEDDGAVHMALLHPEGGEFDREIPRLTSLDEARPIAFAWAGKVLGLAVRAHLTGKADT